MTRVEWITYYESLYDELKEKTEAFNKAAEDFKEFLPKIDELDKYLNSVRRMNDIKVDEAGRLPPDLKRGVLSEDGLYNALEEADRIIKAIKDL